MVTKQQLIEENERLREAMEDIGFTIGLLALFFGAGLLFWYVHYMGGF